VGVRIFVLIKDLKEHFKENVLTKKKISENGLKKIPFKKKQFLGQTFSVASFLKYSFRSENRIELRIFDIHIDLFKE
jgi:hypothetical protein